MKTLNRFVRYLRWLVSPSHGLTTSQVYDLIDTASPTENALYLNLGYWQDVQTIDEASEALAMLVANAGGMGPGDTVLDCGFGFADQDILWARQKRPDRIVGLNITASQVARARQRVTEAALDDRIDLKKGSATEMPVEDDSIDLVIALESAFHFFTREDFFNEAFRVLRPGGRLVTADILPRPSAQKATTRLRQRFSWYLVASRFNIPPENTYLVGPYEEKLRHAGFDDVNIESIRKHVYAPLHDYLAANPAFLNRLHPVARLLARATLRRKASSVYAGLDYVLAVAIKPATDGAT